jgi:uncharacterized phiE125 gp8 family phage protein
MRLKLDTKPAGEVVTLQDMKDHLRFQSDAEDVLIQAAVAAAVANLEGRNGRLNRAFLTQTWTLTLPRFWRGRLGLPFAPLQGVEAITYKTALGATAEVSPALYDVDTASEPGGIALKPGASWPTDLADALDAVTIEFTAGYGDEPSDIPQGLRAAVMLMAADLFQNREAQTMNAELKPNATVDRLISPYVCFNPDPLVLR